MCGWAAMRAAVFALFLVAWVSSASAANWDSREGDCYQLQGFWVVEQEPSGVWVGNVDYRHVGGDCVAPTGAAQVFEVRAAIVGEDFFAVLRGTQTCTMRGRVRGENVRGFGFCLNSNSMTPFALRLSHDQAPGR